MDRFMGTDIHLMQTVIKITFIQRAFVEFQYGLNYCITAPPTVFIEQPFSVNC